MMKYGLKLTLIFVSLIGFLTTQWASAHIHLADQHSHDGSAHSHQAQAHSHLVQVTSNHHTDTIDAASQAHDHDSISINHQYIPFSPEKLKKQSPMVINGEFFAQILFLPEATPPPERHHNPLIIFRNSIIQPRAPPITG